MTRQLLLLAAALPLSLAAASLPDYSLNPKLQAPIKTWDEAIPLGNGLLGGLLWGEDHTLRLSLDRGDLWDERPSKRFLEVRDRFNWATMQRLVAENRMAELNDIFDSNYEYDAPPTKLPAGRLEITLDSSQSLDAFELNLATAEAIARLRGGSEIRAFVSAAKVRDPVAMLRIPGPATKDLSLRAPESVKQLHYPPARPGQDGNLRWFEQPGADGFAYVVCAGWKRAGDATLVAVTVATSAEGKSPLAVARARVVAALKKGYDKVAAPHVAWWARFWQRSSLTVPDPAILQQYLPLARLCVHEPPGDASAAD